MQTKQIHGHRRRLDAFGRAHRFLSSGPTRRFDVRRSMDHHRIKKKKYFTKRFFVSFTINRLK